MHHRLLAGFFPVLLAFTSPLSLGLATTGATAGSTADAATAAPTEKVAYYGSWDIYGSHYYLKNVSTSGAAANLTTLIYGFENIDPVNLTCFQTVKAAGSSESDPNAGDGAGDAWADYQKPFDAATSVNGTADAWNQPLRGNFNQLKELKAKYPNLKVLLSIGGWTFSKYFSEAAATAASRAKFVSSCIDMYIRGNLPTGVAGDTTAGGPGVAVNIFDGIDIDWEFPAADGHYGNIQSPADTANYTALMAEFRSQLNALGSTTGKHYLLTAAVPSAPANIALIQVPQVSQYLDFADVMTYDMHGSWEGTGPTNFQAPLYLSKADPAAGSQFTVSESTANWLAAGLPAQKLVLGIPAYWRGWSGVPSGGENGLYQSATGPSPAFPTTQTPGVANYKELLAAGRLGTVSYDSVTRSPWAYDGSNFWTGDIPSTVSIKAAYVKSKGLRGAMLFALDGDAAGATLVKAMANGLRGTTLAVPSITTPSSLGLVGVPSTFNYSCASGAGTIRVINAQDGSNSPVDLGLATTGNGTDFVQDITWGAAGTFIASLGCGSTTAYSRRVAVSQVNYAALGDSYSSGEGVPPFIPPSDNSNGDGDTCHRSASAYSQTRLWHREWMTDTKFVACSGAKIANFTTGQGPEAAQLDSLSSATSLVSLTVGGNDAGFAPLIEDCAVFTIRCDLSKDAETRAAIKQTIGDLPSLYRTILADAKYADIYVLGYPRIFSSNPPFDCNGLDYDEGLWLNTMANLLNAGIKKDITRIANPHLHFVDTGSAFAGGELCDNPDVAYLNGLMNPTVYSFHPTAEGQEMLSRRLWRAVLPYS